MNIYIHSIYIYNLFLYIYIRAIYFLYIYFIYLVYALMMMMLMHVVKSPPPSSLVFHLLKFEIWKFEIWKKIGLVWSIYNVQLHKVVHGNTDFLIFYTVTLFFLFFWNGITVFLNVLVSLCFICLIRYY